MRRAGQAGSGAEQGVLGDGGDPERLVADLVEQDDEPVLLHPHDDAGAPLAVLDRRLGGERDVVVRAASTCAALPSEQVSQLPQGSSSCSPK